MNDERRKNPRKKPEQLMYVEFGRENGGMIRDLSESGFGFRSVGPLQRGEKVPFSFAFPGGELLRGEAELVWTDGDGRSGGLLFVNLSEEVRRRIRAWCGRETYQPSVPTSREETASTASTFEELRNELRRQISPAAAGTSIAVAEMPASRPAPPVGEVAEVAENPVSRTEAARLDAGSPGHATVPGISSANVAIENGPPIPSDLPSAAPAAPHSLEPRAIEPQQQLQSDEGISLPPQTGSKRTQPPNSPSPSIAPLSFDRGVNLGLDPRPPLQGSLTETSWGENVTVSWVIAAMLVLTLVAAGIVFHNEVGEAFIWLGAKIAGPDHSETVVQQPAPQSTSEASSAAQAENPAIDNPVPDITPPHTTAPAASAAAKPAISPEKQKNQAAPPSLPPLSPSNSKGQPATAREVPRRTGDQAVSSGLKADNPVNSSPGSAAAGDDENGQNALQQAMRILNTDRRSSDIAEAVRLLWIAVEHGSSEAEVVLADLYRTGEGVAQSCDQTHILLTAAARKGNNEAKSRLVELEHTGCP